MSRIELAPEIADDFDRILDHLANHEVEDCVRSNTQANTSAIGNPSINIRMNTRSTQIGASNVGKPIEAACTASHATTR